VCVPPALVDDRKGSAIATLFFDSLCSAIVWEQSFALSAFLCIWVLSTRIMRVYMATEYTRAHANRHHDSMAFNHVAVYAQSGPAATTAVCALVMRLLLRVSLFGHWSLLLSETVFENTLVLIAVAVLIVRSMMSHGDAATPGDAVDDDTIA
jgi:hypothetical protein